MLFHIVQRWNYIGPGGITLPGYDIPEWFLVNEGDMVIFQVPPISDRNVIALTLCVSYSPLLDSFTSPIEVDGFYVTNHTKQTCFIHRPFFTFQVTARRDYLWLGHLPNDKFNLEGGDFVEVFIEVGSDYSKQTHVKVKKIGVSLVWDNNQADFRVAELGTWILSAPYCPIRLLTWIQKMSANLHQMAAYLQASWLHQV